MSDSPGRPRRLLVISNPAAGRRARRRLRECLVCLDNLGAAVTLRETTAPRHAEELARAADPAALDAVVAAGGDGTINEVVNGLVGSPLPLGIIPRGTANVLAAELGLPRQPEALARILAFAPARPVWPGEAVPDGAVAGRRFLVMAGIGFDADVIEALVLSLKHRIGKLAYVASIVGRLRRYRPRRYRAELDGVAADCVSLVAAKAHFYGGHFVLAPAARLDDPMFQVVLFERAGRIAALGYMAALAAGLLPRCPTVRIMPARQVRLIEPQGAGVQLDGDVHVRLPATLRIAATPLQLIHPAQ